MDSIHAVSAVSMGKMEVAAYHKAADVPTQLRSFVEGEEVRNNVVVGVLNRLLAEPSAYLDYEIFGVYRHGQPVGYAHITPPHSLCLACADPQAVVALAGALAGKIDEISGVFGSTKTVDMFLSTTVARRRTISRTSLRGLYKLTEVCHPPLLANTKMVLLRAEDRDLIIEWHEAFNQEVGLPNFNSLEEKDLWVKKIMEKKVVHLLMLGSHPVACASYGRRMPTGRSIGLVYTPRQQRNKGYATQLVAQLSQKILDEGYKYTCLFTDLENKTSNEIYQKIGYKWVEEYTECVFSH